ncbi:MBL fold metallo-hydrolase [Mucilaginibacter gotjawali]|uniref:L-ascorbate metabolism protein UlaG (Beta-lactamase superfamily) n=2 Tax=Mucilaginibacter gotjawali TaxID=1550579 RepID=A0A839SAN9_9SPHI|nr:MBL fold metallo-hydrolase [Mucilaginibacter gotjawali]MBB3054030.1 L-ascorbate metabolism protein UlaG (beta-lactamase superfamily) [Mucilaginibacter gotjawali]BAU54296.1 metal-dependent hydrolase [Mucilaginibacter gotjawali]
MIKNFLWAGMTALSLMVMAGCGLVKSMGEDPKGDELARLDTLPNYKNGSFENLAEKANSSAKHNRWLFLRRRPASIRPASPLPWIKTDLRTLAEPAPTVVWFGHSSLLIKTGQGNILIDPVFSNHAGPVPGLVTAFPGTGHYHAKDMPTIDVLIISHDHYDHLDYRTLIKLKDKIKMAVVPMGVGEDLIYWGFDPKRIIELNWNQSTTLNSGLRITATPAQHRSNRTYGQDNKTLWASYVIQAGNYRLFYGGDGGYGAYFKKIGLQYGPFDLALLECGQYSPNWPWTHLWFGQAAQAAVDLHASLLQPIHWGKFVEADQPWNEPIKTLLPAAEKLGIQVNVPRIGEPYTLGNPPDKVDWWDSE